MKEGVNLKLQVFLLLGLFLSLTQHLIVRAFHECEIGVPIEEVVLLEEKGVGLLLVLREVPNGLDVPILEVLLLELSEHHVFLTELSVTDHKHFKVLFNLFSSLGLNLSSNRVNISEVMLPDPFDKRLILLQRPLEEPSLCEFPEPLLVLFTYDLVVILCMLYLFPQRLQLLKIVIELELIYLGDLDGPVLLGHRLLLLALALLGLFFEVVDVRAEVVLHLIVEAVVEHGSLSLLPALDECGLGLELVLLVLSDDGLDFFSLLAVVFVLEHQHVSLFNFEVEGVLELFGLLSCFLFEAGELTLTLLDNGVNVHKSVVAKHLLLLLEDLCGTVDKDLFIFFLGEGFLRGYFT